MQNNPFNFQEDIKSLITIIRQQQLNPLPSQNLLKKQQDVKEENYYASNQNQILFKQESTCMSQLELKDSVVCAFCQSNRLFSTITLRIFKKQSLQTSTKTFKPIEVQIALLQLVVNQKNLFMLGGTTCGKIIVYKLRGKILQIQSYQISANGFTYMLIPKINNLIFILSSIGIIYLFNYKSGQVISQFQSLIPLIKDPQSKIIIDIGHSLLAYVFTFGRIIVWDISQMRSQSDLSKPSFDSHMQIEEQENIFNFSNENCQDKKAKKYYKNMVLESKMSISNSFLSGILWCDFIGTFFMIIDFNNNLKVLAINVNNRNENQQWCLPISQKQLITNYKKGNLNYKMNIINVRKLHQEGILIGRNVVVEDYGRQFPKKFIIEKYSFDHNYQISKIVRMSFDKMQFADEFYISQTAEYIHIKNSSEYCLIKDRKKMLW